MYEMFEMYLSFLFCTVLVKTAWGAPWVQEQAVFSGPGYEVLGRPAVPVNQRPIVESEKGNSMILSVRSLHCSSKYRIIVDTKQKFSLSIK